MKHEFKVTKSKEQTVYTLESATGGSTSAGSIASMDSTLGGMQRRNPPGDNILAQEKKETPKPRNFVAKNAKMGGAGQHKDKKKAEKQGDVKHKNKDMDMAEGKEDKIAQLKKDHDTAVHWSKNETSPQKREAARQKAEKIKRHLDTQYKQGVAEDHEIQMASSELQSIAKNAVNLLSLVRKYSEQEGLDAWQQSKITKAADYLNSVLQSISGEQSNIESDAYMESLQNMLERSVSQAQHNLMVGVAHNPAFAQKVKVKQKVGQEFARADQGHDISKLPIRVPKKK
jgi:hypothetical protein